ncbi:MAG: DUF4364 family protein [Christensenellaceae bacterium]|jgi:hypothetical protein|nr:DUF4364 family protein [Christensenellaceae bacterium]
MDFVPDSTVNKLILLFVLDKMEIPLTENSIIDICTSRNGWLNYMDCKELLWQLMDAKFIYKLDNEGGESRYNITYEGRNCLSHFFSRVPQSMREEISEFSKQNRMIFKRSQEYVGDYFKNPDGSHTVVLRIKEPLINQPMFEIRIKTASRAAAINACKKWKEKAPTIYENIYETIIND